ncbi:uracil-DNA glycosylase [Microbaculum marinum]|uniref:Type-5 uracil-DNA glycosylase n=1 Tax=Microbaculum marinum TaxID=1764581 RepID=A0AAW9S211_9HYPH
MSEPPLDCRICDRLAAFRDANRIAYPEFYNNPVPSFGPADASLLVVGLAPGLKGANKTGRPFTGDYAGDLLYETLGTYGFARGTYAADPDDGLQLVDCRITNAVRCVPPENKPIGTEIRNCRPFLATTIEQAGGLKAIVALGRIAHDSVLTALDARRASYPFGHGARHDFGSFSLFDSYHCSRYNTNTRRLTPEMFQAVFAEVRREVDARV